MIELKNIRFQYPDRVLLNQVSLKMEGNQLTCVLGSNGSGKSTLFRLATGRLRPAAGEILLNGRAISDLPAKEIARNVSYLPQSRNVPDIRVFDFVLHGRFPYLGYPRVYAKADREIVRQALFELGIAQLQEKYLKQLSGGERQKAYLAMLLAQDTETILLDEPDVFLDIRAKNELYRLILRLKKKGRTIWIITHDLHFALCYSDRICYLENGGLLEFPSGEEFEASRIYRELTAEKERNRHDF